VKEDKRLVDRKECPYRHNSPFKKDISYSFPIQLRVLLRNGCTDILAKNIRKYSIKISLKN
jgi:hypothetical protein